MDKSIEARLDEIRSDIEKMLPVHHECGDNALAATGEPYVEVVIGGEKDSAEFHHAYACSEDAAIRLLHQALIEYVKSKTGTLYWRCFPEIDSMEFRQLSDEVFKTFGSKTFWCGYARLLVSDKPQILPQIIYT